MSLTRIKNVVIVVASILVLFVGWLIVTIGTVDLYGYVDNQGHFVIPPRYTAASPFENGKARVAFSVRGPLTCKGTWQYNIDQQGKILENEFQPGNCYNQRPVEPDYMPGSDTYPQLYTAEVPEGFLRYGYKAKNETLITPPMFSVANFFYNNVAWVSPAEKGPHRWGLINKKGEYVLQPKCSSASSFSDGLAMCRVKTLFGIFY